MKYELLFDSVRGESHIRQGIPCEDSGCVDHSENREIFIAADGHGDTNCPRSRFGADVICQVATEKLNTFVESLSEEQCTDRLFDPVHGEKLIRHLIRSIVASWMEIVNEDFEQHPLTDEERAGCSQYIDRYDCGERIEHIYGTTFMAGVLTDEYLLLLHQGDGHIVLYDHEGEVSEPVSWDDRCFANVCTSMCDRDVISSMRYKVVDLREHPIVACFLGSDGVDDSFFGNEQMYAYYRELLVYSAEHGVEALQTYLEETLPELSRIGSGDDITIAAVINAELAATLIENFTIDNQMDIIKSQIDNISNRIQSMEGGKREYLKERWDSAAKEVRHFWNSTKDAKEKAKKAKQEYEEYESRYENLQAELAEQKEKLIQLQANKKTDKEKRNL